MWWRILISQYSFEQTALEQSLIIFCSESSAKFWWYSRNKFPCTSTSVWAIGLAVNLSEKPLIQDLQSLQIFPYLLSLWSTQICYCSVDTELLDGNNCPINQFHDFIVIVEVNEFHSFPFAFTSLLSSALITRNFGCPLSAKLSIMSSAVFPHCVSDLLP